MCSCLFIEMNQTAHISLQIPSISNSVETKSTGSAPLLCGATRVKSLRVFLPRFPQEHRSVVPSGLPLCASAPPVRGYLRIGPDVRKGFFRQVVIFSSITWIIF